MKKVILSITFLVLSSCGVAEHITQTCTGDLEQVCDVFFGGQKDDAQDKNIDQLYYLVDRLNTQVLENKASINELTVYTLLLRDDIVTLETLSASLQSALNAVTTDVVNNRSLIAVLQNELDNLSLDVDSIDFSIILINLAIGNLQTQSNNNSTMVATLQGYNNITELVDPCGDGVGYDEVLLRLSDGKLLASLSTSNNSTTTRLSEVPPSDSTTYQVTDGTACNFKIPATGPNAKKVCFGTGFTTCI